MKVRTRKAKRRLVQNWCNQHGGTTCRLSEWAVGKLQTSYAKFSARYGKKGAIAIMAAMAATMPIPGNILAVLGVAEGVRAVATRITGNASIDDIVQDVRDLAEQLGLGFDEERFVEAYQREITTNEARVEMPQIRKEHFEDFLDYIRQYTTLDYEDAVDPHDLNAIQSEYSQERVDAIPDEKLKWPILVSKDGYVLDGNHRWIRAGQKGVMIPVLRIGLDRDAALELAREFPQAQFVANWCNQYGGDTCKDGRTGPTERVRAKREKEAKRKQEVESSVDSKTKIVNTFVAGLNAANNIHGHIKGMYLDNVYAAIDNMPAAAINRISAHLTKVDFFKDPKSLGLTAKASPDILRKVRSGEVMIGGYYSTGEQRLALDGGTRTLSAVGVYAHEMTHAIDGPNFEISRSSEWSSAFLHEFSSGQLTKYGATKPSEALAEFGRALYGERVPVATLREKYPRAVAIFEARGLLPTSPNSTRNAVSSLKEIFGEYIETEEGHADAFLDYEPTENRLSARARRKLANNARKTMPGPNKIDPTRTTNIRSSFIKKLRDKFALLRGKVRSLVVTEDAFGLQAGNDLKMATNLSVQNWCNQYGGDTCVSPGGDEGVEPKDREDREIHHLGVNRVVQDTAERWKYKGEINVLDQNGPLFERGGVQWREGGNCHLASGRITIHSGTAGESVEAIQKLTAHEMMHGTFEKVYQQYDADRRQLLGQDIYASGQLKPGRESQFPTYARLWHFREEVPLEQFIKDDGVSEYSRAYWRDFAEGKVSSHIAIHETLAEIAGQHEATGVLVGSKLYRDYYKAVRDEYRVLTGTQRTRRGVGVTKNEAEHVIYLDSNLQPTTLSEAVYIHVWAGGVSTWGVRNSSFPTENRYQFKTSPQKIEEFQKWLRQQFRSTITGMSDEQLWKEFAKQGYLKGAGRAFDDTQGKRRTRRFSPGEGDFYQGSRAEFLRSSFARPETVEKIQLLAGRSFDDLENVTSDMATRMSRTLTDGLSQGMNPREVAELLDEDLKIGGNRAEVIARTEIIRAHAEGQLDSMKSMGVQTVGAEVEWSTAGDGRVCPDCSEMEGKIYGIDDARGLIPMHPQCRCAWLPAGFDKLMSEGGDE